MQEKPDALSNLPLMFNFHALREQWDLLTISMKLPRVIDLLRKRTSKEPTEKDISEETGLPRANIRRSRLLMELPQEYRDQLLADLQRPKNQQQLSEDFFIELEKALKTVERSLPSALPDKNAARDALIEKYKNKTIQNLVDLRYIPKIAHVDKVKASKARAVKVLHALFQPNSYSPKAAYENSVSEAYTEREIISRVNSIADRLDELDLQSLPPDFRTSLRQSIRRLAAFLDKLS